MKIYAVRDRLLDYWMRPFAAEDDKTVMHALSMNINNGETNDPIAQAPHHYELWTLGEVTDDGHLESKRDLLCDCSSLIRASVRDTIAEAQRHRENAGAASAGTGSPSPGPEDTGKRNTAPRAP